MSEGHLWAEHVGAQDQPERVDLLELLLAFKPAWHAHAACRGRTDLMFPTAPAAKAKLAEALVLCKRCPVSSECRDAGMEMSYGIWGGALREPSRRRDATVGGQLRAGEWWSVEDLAVVTGRSVAHVHAQVRKLEHRWTIEVKQRGGIVFYRRQL